MNEENDLDKIKYCPVCGSKKLQKQGLRTDDELSTCVDYYCENCGSNGDLDIYIQDFFEKPYSVQKEIAKLLMEEKEPIELDLDVGESKRINENLSLKKKEDGFEIISKCKRVDEK